VLVRTDDGICVIGTERRYVYANPAACRMLGYPLEQLRGRDFLSSFPAREHATILGCLPRRLGDAVSPFICVLSSADGTGHEVACSTFAIDMAGNLHCVAILRDVSDAQAAVRTALAVGQTTAQLVSAGTIEEILAGIARHAVEGTAAVAAGIVVVGEDHKLTSAGGYGFPEQARSREAWNAGSITLDDLPGADVIVAGQRIVLPDARAAWEAAPVMKAFAATLKGLAWQGGVYVPLSWESRVLGVFGVYLPPGMSGPSEAELAFYAVLADQAAVAVTNARLAASSERTRLARELHDSISQALFSMTMHARAAQLSMTRAGLDASGPLGRSVSQLADLTRGALAEMRALIFELRPGALAEEGLVAALRKQAAALTAREDVTVTIEGLEQRLKLAVGAEEHLYRIVSEALHNVVKHACADHASVGVTSRAGVLQVVVSDDGVGFDRSVEHAGHLGLSTMAERAAAVGADLTIASAPGTGTTVTVTLPHRRPDQGSAGTDAS
jgi:PAS domain S-box-containing protein